jgi:hypothetical protein
MEEIELWLKGAGQVGIPAALLGAVFYGLWQIIKWSGRRLDRLVSAHARLMRTLAQNDTRHAVAAEASAGGHHTTQEKLEKVHDDVRAIKGAVCKTAA